MPSKRSYLDDPSGCDLTTSQFVQLPYPAIRYSLLSSPASAPDEAQVLA